MVVKQEAGSGCCNPSVGGRRVLFWRRKMRAELKLISCGRWGFSISRLPTPPATNTDASLTCSIPLVMDAATS